MCSNTLVPVLQPFPSVLSIINIIVTEYIAIMNYYIMKKYFLGQNVVSRDLKNLSFMHLPSQPQYAGVTVQTNCHHFLNDIQLFTVNANMYYVYQLRLVSGLNWLCRLQ